jgi:transcriptional regulator with XRE-family HTH domain
VCPPALALATVAANGSPPVGSLLRSWRERRRLSQLALAHLAQVSPKHLSFVETGRAVPSPEMVLHLARHLDVPLRHRNDLLLAAGYAPRHTALAWDDEELAPIRHAVRAVLAGHEPAPAIVVDRRWDLVDANRAAAVLTEGVAPQLLEPPVNVLRSCLHPAGLAPRIRNVGEWADHILTNLAKQLQLAPDPALEALHEELLGYAEALAVRPGSRDRGTRLAVPLHLATRDGDVRLVATIATFGTAVDATLAELAIEAFLPADAGSRRVLERRRDVAA